MARRQLDKAQVQDALLRILRSEGLRPAGELPRRLNISHATLSRIIKSLSDDIVIMGRGRATFYALRRQIEGVPDLLPVFEVLPDGRSRRLGELRPLMHHSFALWSSNLESAQVFPDLPYFLDDARPAGFMGRLVPQRHPEMGLPEDIQMWSADICLRYLCRHGWNLPGSLIVGDDAFRRYLEQAAAPADRVDIGTRKTMYPKMANDMLLLGAAGSSAAGEQPKFIATRYPDHVPVVVKFSPPTTSEVGERLADLLICEHLALETIRAHGQAAAISTLIQADHRVFLEVERFDRTSDGGRRGLLSLHCLHAKFIGNITNWTAAVEALAKIKKVPQDCVDKVRWLEVYSKLIANNDRHFGNISFMANGLEITELAPAYDVLPMLFVPRGHQVIQQNFDPPLPSTADATVWESASAAACDFWQRASTDTRISAGFRNLSAQCYEKVARSAEFARRLP